MPRDIREPLKICIDLREGMPWAWESCDVTPVMASLVAGDYALDRETEIIRGREMRAVRFAIERKSISDWAGTISSGWPRFVKELDRMSGFPARIIIVAGNFEQCCYLETENGITPPSHGHPMIEPAFVARRIAELSLMQVSVLFAGNEGYAAALALHIFRRRSEMLDAQDQK